jgi:hypothetical protein
MMQDLIICLQEFTAYFILKKTWLPQTPADCFVNPACGCENPGKKMQCEECPYLEACLSSFKLQKDHRQQLTGCRGLRQEPSRVCVYK